ncbi:virion morphogenesis [Cetacean poxvirus 1]|nr:virion morphogenesis [Cetacean poxvirus 1]
MDKLKCLYDEFYCISKEYLERETCTPTDPPDFDNDVSTLMALLPILEKKVCTIESASNDSIILMMKYCDYQIFSFWFLKSGAVVKSVYNKLDDSNKSKFVDLFRNILINTHTLIYLNAMYSNIKRDTIDIVNDSKKIIEIVNSVRSANGEANAYHLLQQHYTFIVKTINKIMSDKNYLLKLVAVFDNDLLADKERLDNYRELLFVSTEGAIYGLQCISNITIASVVFEGNKYITFFKKVLSNVIIFQNNDLNHQRFIVSVYKLYVLLYRQLTDNQNLSIILHDVIESLKNNISVDEITAKGVKNLRDLINFISTNKSTYKDILCREYECRENVLLQVMQEIVNENGVEYNNQKIDVSMLVKKAKENFFSKL